MQGYQLTNPLTYVLLLKNLIRFFLLATDSYDIFIAHRRNDELKV
jgi:hypothetical protein